MPRKFITMFGGDGDDARMVLEGLEVNIRKTPGGVILSKMEGETIVAEKEIPMLKSDEDWSMHKVIDNSFGPSLFGCFAIFFGKQEQLFEEVTAYSIGPSLAGKTRSMMVITVYGKKQAVPPVA